MARHEFQKITILFNLFVLFMFYFNISIPIFLVILSASKQYIYRKIIIHASLDKHTSLCITLYLIREDYLLRKSLAENQEKKLMIRNPSQRNRKEQSMKEKSVKR